MTGKKSTTAILAALLSALVVAVYWQTTGFELINLDDLYYTVLHPVVKEGLTLSGIRTIFTSVQLDNFMPVTLLSFMADVQIFGLKPSGFHFTNTLLHLLNTLLLFSFLYRATGSPLKSFFAAALWAVHPLRAESVAWVAERKDVLAGFFFLAGLLTYCEYAKSKRPVFYAAALAAMVLGLLSKSIVVVFPLVLLILDFWPFERLREPGKSIKNLLVEKIPFFALAIFFSALTIFVHRNALYVKGQKPIPGRLADMATSYFHYLKATAWPFGLVMDDRNTAAHLTGVAALGAGVLILALSFLAWRARKNTPSVTAGWFWYLAVLFPVSGVILLDFYFVADHFSYLPHIGLMIVLVWGAERLYGQLVNDIKPLIVAGGVLAIVLSVLCFRQVSLWKDDLTLFGYIDKATGGQSALAKFTLGLADSRAGKDQEAYEKYSEALALDPNYIRVNGYKGIAAANLGKFREAAVLLRKELAMYPGDRDFSTRLAIILVVAGDLPGGAKQSMENIRRWPDDKTSWEVINYLGGEAKARALAGR